MNMKQKKDLLDVCLNLVNALEAARPYIDEANDALYKTIEEVEFAELEQTDEVMEIMEQVNDFFQEFPVWDTVLDMEKTATELLKIVGKVETEE